MPLSYGQVDNETFRMVHTCTCTRIMPASLKYNTVMCAIRSIRERFLSLVFLSRGRKRASCGLAPKYHRQRTSFSSPRGLSTISLLSYKRALTRTQTLILPKEASRCGAAVVLKLIKNYFNSRDPIANRIIHYGVNEAQRVSLDRFFRDATLRPANKK